MKTSMNRPSLRGLVYVCAAAATVIAADSAFAQQGGGMCQRGSAGMNGGPPSGMMGPGNYNSQGAGFMPGAMPRFPPPGMPGYGPGNFGGNTTNGPVAQSPTQTRQALQAKFQARQDRVRQQKEANKAANLSRQKSKPTRSSSSPTA